VYRPEDIGAAAANALRARWASAGHEVVDRPLHGKGPTAIASALTGLRPSDRVVFWLRNSDLKVAPAQLPADVEIYASGTMGGLEAATPPAAWRPRLRMTYPYALPDARRVLMNFPLNWFRVEHIPVVDERIQSNTYLACQILAETLGHMLDSFVPDYLLERLEMQLSKRIVTGYFPRFGLGPGQRFASKGGYLVHFADADGPRLVAETPWIVP
jgi:hypothetical protein